VKVCAVCHLRIFPGQAYRKIESGIVELSKKSGRDLETTHSIELIHLLCFPDYLCKPEYGAYDSLVDRAMKHAREEVNGQVREEIKAEIYDEVVDEIGRTCAVCQEEIEEMAAESDRPAPPTPVPYQPFQAPPYQPVPYHAPVPAPHQYQLHNQKK
jgi:hypothetical protein